MRVSRWILPVVLLFGSLQYSISEPQPSAGYPVTGQILLPDREVTPPAKVQIILSSGGRFRQVAYPSADGSFRFQNVQAGTHLLDVKAIGYVYPELRLEVSSKYNGRVTAAYAENPLQTLPAPLTLRPALKAEFFEKSVPFDVMAFLKSPMGIMVAFMAAAMFLLPKLKVDPEEYAEMMASRAGTSEPTPAAALQVQGGSQGGGARRRAIREQ